MQPDVAARDRLLLAAAQLMEGGDRSFSTRAVCDLAGVKAPTLYHHFGNKQGLIDGVLQHGFTQYVSTDATGTTDPVQALREGWDKHVDFGLAHPAFYALLYGDVQPGQPCAITAPATEMLLQLLDEAARRRMLRVPPAEAAAQILAANVGVTLSLIAQPDDTLSDRVREAALAAVLVAPKEEQRGPSRATAAIALTAALDQNPNDLTPGELTLLRELLERLKHDV
jgi:AcrR family transcriptional regulator